MLNLSEEAKVLRDRISRYSSPNREELNKLLKLEFEFIQLLDLILRLYPLDAQTHEAIAHLEESRTWAVLSVKRGSQVGYKSSDYRPPSNMHLASSESIEFAFKTVFNAILNRCMPNREMDLALARLDQARVALELVAAS